MQIVCLVGVDRTGKSTLADWLVENKGFEYVHFGKPESSPYEEYKKFVKKLKEERDTLLEKKYVIDRFVWCEYAYSRFYRRVSDCPLERVRELERDLGITDAEIVFCKTDAKSNLERIKEEGKNEITSEGEIDFINSMYEEVLKNSVLLRMDYDFTKGDSPEKLFASL